MIYLGERKDAAASVGIDSSLCVLKRIIEDKLLVTGVLVTMLDKSFTCDYD